MKCRECRIPMVDALDEHGLTVGHDCVTCGARVRYTPGYEWRRIEYEPPKPIGEEWLQGLRPGCVHSAATKALISEKVKASKLRHSEAHP